MVQVKFGVSLLAYVNRLDTREGRLILSITINLRADVMRSRIFPAYLLSIVWLRAVLRWLIIPVMVGLAQPVLAQTSMPISISVFEDPSDTIAVEQVLEAPESFTFVPINKRRSFGVSRSSFWFKLDIPAQQQTQQAILEVTYPLLDVVDIYTRYDSRWQLLALGDTRAVEDREFAHHLFLKSLRLQAGQAQRLFLRVRSNGPVIVPIKIWKMADFHQHDHDRSLFEGLYFGVLLALIIFNLFVYLSIRSKSYLYYVGYLSFITLFLLSLEGMVVTYFLSDNLLLAGKVPFVSLYFALIIAFKFTASINNTHIVAPGLIRIFNLYSLLLSIVLIIGIGLGGRFITQVTPYLTMGAIVLYTHAIVRGIRARYQPSYFVGFAFSMLLPGAILYVLRIVGIWDSGSLPEYVFKSGVALEALLLSLVLSYKIRYAQNRLAEVQQMASEARRGFSQKLIETRDQELQQLAMELHDGLGQNLLAIKNKIGRVLRSDLEEQQRMKAARVAQEIAQSTIDDMRRISHQLHPHILDRLGLKEAIIQVANTTCDGQGIAVVCHVDNIQSDKHRPLALHLYRIVQEAVKNCAVHADAKRIEIELHQQGAMLVLRIEDFPNERAGEWLSSLDFSHSFGLSNIRERVELLMGNTVFSTNDSGGFKIQIEVPFSA